MRRGTSRKVAASNFADALGKFGAACQLVLNARFPKGKEFFLKCLGQHQASDGRFLRQKIRQLTSHGGRYVLGHEPG